MLVELPNGKIVDDQTGEIVNKKEIYLRDGEDYTIYKCKSEPDSNFIPWGKDRPFIKVFLDYMPQLALKLSGGALATAFRLTEYINYGSGLLSKRGGNPLCNADIQRIMGYSEKTTVKIMTELVDKKILFRGRTGHCYQYYANPYLFSKGTVINSTLAAMFKDYPREFSKSKIIEGVEQRKMPLKP